MKRSLIYVAALCSLILLNSCIHEVKAPQSAEEQSYSQKVAAFPTRFIIPKSELPDAWGRAQSFISQYSDMKIQIATNNVIQTYNPSDSSINIGYSVSNAPMGDNAIVTVKCLNTYIGNVKRADFNAHALAYYMKTGEVNPRFLTHW
jgi:hypothetical protein